MFDEDVNRADDMFAAMNRSFGRGMGFGEFIVILLVLIALAWVTYFVLAHTPVGKQVRTFLVQRGIMKKRKSDDDEDEDRDKDRDKDEESRPERRPKR